LEVKIGEDVILISQLGSILQKNREINEDATHDTRRKTLGVICDCKVPNKLKEKFYRIAVRLTILCGCECRALKE